MRRTERWAAPGLPPSLLVALRVWRDPGGGGDDFDLLVAEVDGDEVGDLLRRASSKAACPGCPLE